MEIRVLEERENPFLDRVETETGMNKAYALIYYYPNGIDFSQIEPPDRVKVAANYLREKEKEEG